MASTQFGINCAVINVVYTATLAVETGFLETICVVPEDVTLPANTAYANVLLLQGGLTESHAIARLCAGYVSALDGPGWSGRITLKPNMAIYVRAQSSQVTRLRIGLNCSGE